eukprot:TRINITY_DN9698_c0_g1_i1.p1 TRINITY_DN9698_c0_g1~~TRINITY_DN9698_c0_g1_i1.p1  ORF type:complete len:229 (+),score=50.51 TRINITY_DN9698_c0_g1_i1:557-1243(+)
MKPSNSQEMIYGTVGIVFMEYRGFGIKSEQPHMRRIFEDLKDLNAALEIPLENVIVFGRSLGSLVATQFVEEFPGTAGIIIESGLGDFSGHLIKKLTQDEAKQLTRDDLRNACHPFLDQQHKMSRYTGNILIIHTEDDAIVPVSNALDLHFWGGSTKPNTKRLLTFAHGDHNFIWPMNWELYIEAVRDFVKQCGGSTSQSEIIPYKEPHREELEQKPQTIRSRRCSIM